MQLTKIIGFILAIKVAFTQIKLVGPPEFVYNSVLSNQNNTVNFTMANFGFYPWGQRIVAPVVVADPVDACSEINIDRDPNSNFRAFHPIIIVKRGGCKFTDKARNVQSAGGKVALIYDDVIEENVSIAMADDGSGDSVYITTVFVREVEGEKLLGLAKKGIEQNQYLTIQLNFEIQQTNYQNVGIFINLPDHKGLFFLRDLSEVYHKYYQSEKHNTVYFHPIYQYMSLQEFENEGGNSEFNQNDNCLGKNQYCCFDPDGAGSATGSQIANEQLRQSCVHKTLGFSKYLKFMVEFIDEEARPQTYDARHKEILNKLFNKGEIEHVDDCVTSSFLNNGVIILDFFKYYDQTNTVIQDDMKLIETSGIYSWPAVHINNIIYQGRFAFYPVEMAICDAQLNVSERCKVVLYGKQESSSGMSTFGILAIILSILFVVFVLIHCGYKRYIKERLSNEMQGQQQQMIANYVKIMEQQSAK